MEPESQAMALLLISPGQDRGWCVYEIDRAGRSRGRKEKREREKLRERDRSWGPI